ncbi:hypothetical protein A2U01_0003450, partial [Trifolium medium]|nr:hypothetical protein [Trifolium medium]
MCRCASNLLRLLVLDASFLRRFQRKLLHNDTL